MNSPRQFVVFDVRAEYAHYRRPYAITTALTFPLPPRTALCGLIGAVVGLPKDDGLNELLDHKALFAVQLVEPVRFGHISLNLIDTKDNRTFRPKPENPHTIMRYEVIREPRYRVFFSHDTLATHVHDLLAQGRTTYTPCCGLAWMIATFDDDPILRIASEETSTSSVDCVTPIRASACTGPVEWHREGVYQRIRMPAEMQPPPRPREVTRHEEYVIDRSGLPIRAPLNTYWKLDDGTCFSLL